MASSRKLRFTLLSSEWGSTKGGLSTFNRELAIQLAKHDNVEVSMYLPQCSEEDITVAKRCKVNLVQAGKLIGYDPIEWLSCTPENHQMDFVIGHGLVLGRQVQVIQRQHRCKWVQVVHTAPEELGMFKGYADAISRGEKKHLAEMKFCELADQVVAVGPKLADGYKRYLRYCQKDQTVLELTPGLFAEFSDVKQATEERSTFRVLVFGRGDNEDFELKGYDIAAKAISDLNDKSYELMFVGAPPGKEEEVADRLLKQGIARRQLKVRSFEESREDLARLFCEVDLAVMPSRTEGFGLAALEALSAGLPILVSGNSGFGDALKKVPHGSNWIVNSEDPKEWAKAIKSVRTKDRDVRLEESKDLRRRYGKKYSWEQRCAELVRMMTRNFFGTGHATAGEQSSSMASGRHMETSVSEGYKGPNEAGCLSRGSSDRQAAENPGKRPLRPSTTPLLKEQRVTIDNSVVVELLRAEYNRRAQLRPLPWDSTFQLPLESVYTRLKIVPRRKAGVEKNGYESATCDDFLEPCDNMGVQYKGEDLAEEGDSEVNPCDIFGVQGNGDAGMTIIEGSPGMGKTTFCLKLACDWANESSATAVTFPKFEFVLLLKCRDIDGDLMEAIVEQLLPNDINEKTREKFLDFITDLGNQKKILIILDGLDELPEESKHHVDELLHRNILPFCYVLATARQEKGIELRKQFVFCISLQSEGFTENDSFEYIRKHFKNVVPEKSSKGERLIEEMKENTLLHALRNNPLNLLLLCVVYEDHEGQLPSSLTNLFQIIVWCLLRRFCAKRGEKVCDEDGDLEKRFEKDILAIGKLAWNCLLKERHSFLEGELKELERNDDKLVARGLGLLYKEESLKRLKPQHEYCFLHKSFQEYLAASYIAQKLQQNQFNVFEHLEFDDVVKKYPQVFLFVCGILGEEASVLFTQIGEKLKSHWDWLKCRKAAATFFLESLNESGSAERVADSLFSFLPFPRVLRLSLHDTDLVKFGDDVQTNLFKVMKACTSLSKLQTPVEVHIRAKFSVGFLSYRGRSELLGIVSLRKLKTLDLSFSRNCLTESHADAMFQRLSTNTSLSELTFTVPYGISDSNVAAVGKGLAACKTLQKVTFTLYEESSAAWARALEAGLCADTPLSSVGLRFCGPTSETSLQALEKLILNQSLSSLCLVVCGDLQDSLAAALATGLTGQTTVTLLDLCVHGNMNFCGANAIERGIVGNQSLNHLKVTVHGELPDNWKDILESERLAKPSLLSSSFYPHIFSKVSANQATHFRPFAIENGSPAEQHVTVNFLGEICWDRSAEAFCGALISSPLSGLTFNVHGKLVDGIFHCTARRVDQHKMLSTVTINIWGQLKKEGKTLFNELELDKNPAVTLRVHDVPVPSDESSDNENVAVDSRASLAALFAKEKSSGKKKLNLTIKIEGSSPGNSTRKDGDWGYSLCAGLASNNSLSALALAINSKGTWGFGLGEGLATNTSLNAVTLTINDYRNRNWDNALRMGLARNTSLNSLTVTINNYSIMDSYWGDGLGTGLASNTSLNCLTLTMNNYSEMSGGWGDGFGDGFARNSSLNAVTLRINNYNHLRGDWGDGFSHGLAGNTSLSAFTLTINNYSDMSGDWADSLGKGLARNTSLNAFTLTINNYSDMSGNWGGPVGVGLSKMKSLTTCNLTFNICGEVSANCLPDLLENVMKSESLETLRVNITDHRATNGSRGYDFSKFVAKSPSLLLIELTVSFYGVEDSSSD